MVGIAFRGSIEGVSMGKLGLIVGAVALVLVAGALAAGGKSKQTYRATMTAAGGVPRPKAPAGADGTFTATVTGSGTRSISWKLTFSHLSGPALAAHIHRGKAGTAGPVVLTLCGPCTSGKAGTARISADAADLLERGLAYVNVHTAKNPAGEVRGQVKLTGEDSGVTAPPKTKPAPTPPPPSPPSSTVPDGYY
jgi:CHRD domain